MIAKIRISGTNWAMALPSMGVLLQDGGECPPILAINLAVTYVAMRGFARRVCHRESRAVRRDKSGRPLLQNRRRFCPPPCDTLRNRAYIAP
ncbi:hypothetical protein GCM10011363_12740 [Marivita lacus]|uniref:Uncharacterized protein n=1 Tax=Marivita lacus TaxID=1323742 RepID=A0ABQ1KFH3_9RHOB|nr:hypothetical protein GCM10011363_12740 [Marivita lacus]